jgi:DNA mismatch repair protein MSH5
VNGVYILRTVVPADFSFEKGRQKLAALDSKIFGQQSTILTGVAETVDYEEDGGTDASRLSKYMRLSTVIDLESRLTVSGRHVPPNSINNGSDMVRRLAARGRC